MLTVASEDERRARDELTASAWAAGLTLPQFRERERRLRAHPWAAKALTTFLWRDAESGEVLASCEAFVDEARVGARTGTAATIASVFTEPRLRGHGAASAMLRAVVAHLNPPTPPLTPSGVEGQARPHSSGPHDPLAVTLYSEIGTAMYQRLGFWPVPAFDTFFAARADAPSGVTFEPSALPSPAHAPAPADTLRLSLSACRLDWHLERERVYAEALGRTPLEVHGARVGDSSITWTAYWKTNELQVLSLDVRDDAHRVALCHAAAHAAHRAGLPVVRVWETTPLADLPGARRVERTDEIAMFLPLAPGMQAWTQIERGLWA